MRLISFKVNNSFLLLFSEDALLFVFMKLVGLLEICLIIPAFFCLIIGEFSSFDCSSSTSKFCCFNNCCSCICKLCFNRVSSTDRVRSFLQLPLADVPPLLMLSWSALDKLCLLSFNYRLLSNDLTEIRSVAYVVFCRYLSMLVFTCDIFLRCCGVPIGWKLLVLILGTTAMKLAQPSN